MILITFYWVSMIESISSKKIRNRTEKAPSGVLGEITEDENYSRVKLIFESNFFSVVNWLFLL